MFPRRSLLFLFFAITAAMSIDSATDPDMWWHLRTGDLISQGELPRGDVFSFTVPGREWITHEWLSQLVMWLVWSVAGAPALVLFFAAVTMAAFFLAFKTSTARDTVTAGVMALSAMAASMIVGPRPQMFNLFGLALTMFVLERVRRGERTTRDLWFLPLIVGIWANFHSGYLLGVAVIAVYAVGERLQQTFGSDRASDPTMVRRLPGIAVLSFLAAGLNPSTWQLWLYPFETLRSEAMRNYIVEWHSPDFHEPMFYPFVALLAVSAISAGMSKRSLRWTQGLLLCGTAAAGLQSIRNIPIFAMVAIPIVAPMLAEVLDDRKAARDAIRGRSGSPVGFATPLLAALGALVFAAFATPALASNDAITEVQYPVAALDAALDSELADQPVFNNYGWGGYMIWRGMDVFIDGRADVYGDDFMNEYWEAFTVGPNWRDTLDNYDVQWVLIRPGSQLAVVLEEVPDWNPAYEDDVAIIYARCETNCPQL